MPSSISNQNAVVPIPKTTPGNHSAGVQLTMMDPTEQDSDLLERLGDGVFTGSAATGDVQLVSLGASCGPKLSFKEIGRGAETLPFDWSRTKVEAVKYFIAQDFQGFFDAPNCIKFTDPGGADWTAFRSNFHSFWHDDPNVPAMRERYTRRIHRFLSIDARTKPVLFVRSVAHSSEIIQTGELLQLLLQKFGPQARLLLVVDFQSPTAAGAFRVDGLDNLMLYFLNTPSCTSQAAPYCEVLKLALEWAIGLPVSMGRFSSLAEAQRIAIPTDWGYYGGGQPAFLQM